ncbi:MAG: hypothetical protein WCO30_02060 [bacterium]
METTKSFSREIINQILHKVNGTRSKEEVQKVFYYNRVHPINPDLVAVGMYFRGLLFPNCVGWGVYSLVEEQIILSPKPGTSLEDIRKAAPQLSSPSKRQ